VGTHVVTLNESKGDHESTNPQRTPWPAAATNTEPVRQVQVLRLERPKSVGEGLIACHNVKWKNHSRQSESGPAHLGGNMLESAAYFRRWRWTMAVVVFACAVLIVWLWALQPDSTREFNQAQFDRIKEGMTETEVEQIIGCPAGTYADKKDILLISDPWPGQADVSNTRNGVVTFVLHGLPSATFPLPTRFERVWAGRRSTIYVRFDGVSGRTIDTSFGRMSEQTLYERLPWPILAALKSMGWSVPVPSYQIIESYHTVPMPQPMQLPALLPPPARQLVPEDRPEPPAHPTRHGWQT
jgi:hypothetical protein